MKGMNDKPREKKGLYDAFHKEEDRPMATIQKAQNRRPQISHKFAKVAKIYTRNYQTGRKPSDIRPRWKETIPPTRKKIRET